MRNARSASRGTGSHVAVGLLRALWKRYEHHCTQTDSCPCILLKEDILLQIEKQQTLKKVLLCGVGIRVKVTSFEEVRNNAGKCYRLHSDINLSTFEPLLRMRIQLTTSNTHSEKTYPTHNCSEINLTVSY